MIYTSTRDKSIGVSASEAIAKGISSEGGLFVPTEIPTLSLDDIKRIGTLDYIGRAKEVLKLFLTDFTEEELDMLLRFINLTIRKISLSFGEDLPVRLRIWLCSCFPICLRFRQARLLKTQKS